MNIVLAIKPKWAKLIYEGKKTIEWRKTLPRKMDLKLLRDGNPNVKVYLYETAPGSPDYRTYRKPVRKNRLFCCIFGNFIYFHLLSFSIIL